MVDEDFDKYKDSGKCGTQKDGRAKHEDECICINQNCCSGDAKCNSNKSFCNKMGFNCPKDEDASFFFDFAGLGIDCGKYDTSDCSDDDDEDLNAIAVEEIESVIENAIAVDEVLDKDDVENNIALFAETVNNDIKCIWNSPFQACKGQYPVLYTCSVAKYSKVCCTVSSITKPKFNTYGQCTKGGSVPAPTPPAPKPTQANLQCIWNSPFKKCTGQHPVLYSCSVAKYSKVCCTVSTIYEANMSPYGRCTIVPNDLEIKVE